MAPAPEAGARPGSRSRWWPAWSPPPPSSVGWVDVAKKESQLRTYAVVAKRHKGRYDADLDINEDEYERFLNELVDTLFYGGIKILVQVPDEEPDAPPGRPQAPGPGARRSPSARGRSRLGTLLLVLLTFALGVGVGHELGALRPLIDRMKALIRPALSPCTRGRLESCCSAAWVLLASGCPRATRAPVDPGGRRPASPSPSRWS